MNFAHASRTAALLLILIASTLFFLLRRFFLALFVASQIYSAKYAFDSTKLSGSIPIGDGARIRGIACLSRITKSSINWNLVLIIKYHIFTSSYTTRRCWNSDECRRLQIGSSLTLCGLALTIIIINFFVPYFSVAYRINHRPSWTRFICVCLRLAGRCGTRSNVVRN